MPQEPLFLQPGEASPVVVEHVLQPIIEFSLKGKAVLMAKIFIKAKDTVIAGAYLTACSF